MSEEIVLDEVQTEVDVARQELERVKKEIEEKKQELKSVSSREISQDEKESAERQKARKSKNREVEAKILKQKEYDNVKVTGKFMNLRYPGQTKKLPYIKYNDDPVVWHTLEHGKVYTIPRGFADQINGGSDENPCYYMPKFKQKQGDQVLSSTTGENSAIDSVDTSHKMYAFVPVSF